LSNATGHNIHEIVTRVRTMEKE